MVWLPFWDCAGLERLLRYCARLVFAGERLNWLEPDQRLAYQLPKPRPDGQTELYLTPLEFLDRLAAPIPRPRKHRHRYHGVLAPNSPLRLAVTAYARLPIQTPAHPSAVPVSPTSADSAPTESAPASHARTLCAVLIARVYEILPLICPECGGEMRLIAFVTDAEPVWRILAHLDEPVRPPPISPARLPPEQTGFDRESTSAYDPERGDPMPEFDKSSGWTICTAKRPEGWRTGRCAMNSTKR